MVEASLLCLIFAAGAEFALAQDGATDGAASLTLEQLRTEGLRSRYRQQREIVSSVAEDPSKDSLASFKQHVEPVLKETCVPCHGPDHVEGNIRIDTLNPDLANGPDAHWWLEVQAVLSNGEMPPPDAKALSDSDRSRLVDWLADEIQRASKVRRATGGHSSFRRMTQYEYNYALQDLLGVPWNFAKDLPPESHSDDGFQNSSELLHMSVGQLESYRQIALTALRRVTVKGDRPPVIHWGVSMEEAADREWPKQQEQLAKAREQFKDDPVRMQEEVTRLTASFKQPHDRPYYRELSSGDTVRAAWDYGGAKYAFDPEGAEPKFPETFDHVAVIPSGRNQELTVELGDTIPDEGIMRVRVRASKEATEPHRIPSLQLEFGFQASNEGRAEIRVSTADTPSLRRQMHRRFMNGMCRLAKSIRGTRSAVSRRWETFQALPNMSASLTVPFLRADMAGFRLITFRSLFRTTRNGLRRLTDGSSSTANIATMKLSTPKTC